LITIDPPAAANGSFSSAITPDGMILGVYFDANFNSNGFLRDSSGTFTTINGPSGLTGQSDPFIFFGAALSTNLGGEIAGTFFEPIAGVPIFGLRERAPDHGGHSKDGKEIGSGRKTLRSRGRGRS
jgi:hypothetical protein